jgi:hypothetical protein
MAYQKRFRAKYERKLSKDKTWWSEKNGDVYFR